MRMLSLILLTLLVALQYQLWLGEGGYRKLLHMSESVAAQEAENARLAERNHRLLIEVSDLKEGQAAIEERARSELGFIRPNETFYLTLDPHE